MYPVLRKGLIFYLEEISHRVRSKTNQVNSYRKSYSQSTNFLDVRRLRSVTATAMTAPPQPEAADKCPLRGSSLASHLEDICLVDDEPLLDAVEGVCAASQRFTIHAQSHREEKEEEKSAESDSMSLASHDGDVGNIQGANAWEAAVDEMRQHLSEMRWTQYSFYGLNLVKNGDQLKSIQDELVSVVTYNVLSQTLLETHRNLYRHHDKRSLSWARRSQVLLEEIAVFDADILCLQEVDSEHLASFYEKELTAMGYKGVFKQRTNDKIDGCAIYYKTDKLTAVQTNKVEFYKPGIFLLDRDNIGIVMKLRLNADPSREVVVGTTHLLYNPRRNDIKLAQTQLMLAEIERVAYVGHNALSNRPEYLPVILTGDMNYIPFSGTYNLVHQGVLQYEGLNKKFLTAANDSYNMHGTTLNRTLIPSEVGVTDTCQYLSSLATRSTKYQADFESGTLGHFLNLDSVYDHSKKDLPEATTNQDAWLTVDYMFYSQAWSPEGQYRVDGPLKLVSRLTLPNSEEAETKLRFLPNAACASDHLPLLATFHLT